MKNKILNSLPISVIPFLLYSAEVEVSSEAQCCCCCYTVSSLLGVSKEFQKSAVKLSIVLLRGKKTLMKSKHGKEETEKNIPPTREEL